MERMRYGRPADLAGTAAVAAGAGGARAAMRRGETIVSLSAGGAAPAGACGLIAQRQQPRL